MKAQLLFKDKQTDESGDIFEQVVWRVPADPRHPQGLKYRFAFVPKGAQAPAVLFDNHHPKGHHKHLDDLQVPYMFISLEQLQQDFRDEIAVWKHRRGLE